MVVLNFTEVDYVVSATCFFARILTSICYSEIQDLRYLSALQITKPCQRLKSVERTSSYLAFAQSKSWPYWLQHPST